MNPGLSYVAKTSQVASEAIVPLNNEAGRGVGFEKLARDIEGAIKCTAVEGGCRFP